MTTTTLSPTAVERAAQNKSAQAKPNGQSNAAPGAFAALLQLTDGDALSNPADATVAADTEPDRPTETTAALPSNETAQQMLLSLMEWRGTPAAPREGPANGPAAGLAALSQETEATGAGQHQSLHTSSSDLQELATSQSATALPGKGWTLPTPADTATNAALTERLAAITADTPSAMQPTVSPPLPAAVTQGATPSPAAASSPMAAAASVLNSGSSEALQPNGKSKSSPARSATATPRHEGSTNAPDLQANSKVIEPVAQHRATLDLAPRSESTAPTSTAGDASERTADLKPATNAAQAGTPSATSEGLPVADAPQRDTPPSPETPAPGTDAFAEAMQAQLDDVAHHIGQWAARGTQRASFTVDAKDGTSPLEVSVTFNQGELNVAFETNEAAVRDVLETNAHEALQQLLEAQGISLGSVSVNSGGGRSPQDPSEERSTLALATRARAAQGKALEGQVQLSPLRPANIMTATQLDFYA